MKKYFKYLLITISLSFLTMSTNVFAENEEKNKNEDFSTYTVSCHSEEKEYKIYENKEEYYENLGNLAVYSLLHEIPDISKETLKNVVLSWNDGRNRKYRLNTYIIFDKDNKKIKNFYKDISKKIQQLEKKKDNEDELEKYIEKLVENKNINLNNLKNKYTELIKKTIKDNKKEIESLEKELKKSNNDKFFIEFAKKDIKEENQKREERNILEEVKFKNDKKLIEEGKKRAERKIKKVALINEKLERNIKDTEKIKKLELNSILKKIFKSNGSFFTNGCDARYGLRISFKNKSYNTDIINYLYSRHLMETLDKELAKQKENRHIKKSIEKTNKEFKDLIKNYQKEKKLEDLDMKEIKKHLKYGKGIVINPTTIDFEGRCCCHCSRDSIYLSNEEKGLLEIITKLLKSDEFKKKLKKSLTKERFEKLKKEFLEYIEFSDKYAKMAKDKLMKKNSLDLGQNNVKEDIKWQKENLERNKKRQKDKNEDMKQIIKNNEKSLKESEKKLKNREELKEIGEEKKENELEEYKYEKSRLNHYLKQLKNVKFKDMQRAKDLIKLKKIKLNQY